MNKKRIYVILELLDNDNIVGSIVFLLSNSSKYINRQNIIVDDGWSL